jgi:hypothetical protein
VIRSRSSVQVRYLNLLLITAPAPISSYCCFFSTGRPSLSHN